MSGIVRSCWLDAHQIFCSSLQTLIVVGSWVSTRLFALGSNLGRFALSPSYVRNMFLQARNVCVPLLFFVRCASGHS